MKTSKRKIFKIVWFTLVGLFSIWQWTTFQARGLPNDLFTDDNQVTVRETSDRITFQAEAGSEANEIIFLQGGMADPEAYAPLCRQLAIKGYTTHLMKMEWRMPKWGYQRVVSLFPLQEGKYIIGGHSQGGKMAAQLVYENPGLFKGLFLLGTSHPRDYSLADRDIPTLKLYGELDGLATVEEVRANEEKLPKDAILQKIRGGNHSQFGYLGTLLTDNPAAISLAKQQQVTVAALADFCDGI